MSNMSNMSNITPVDITVTSAYQTKFGELWDKSLYDLIAETIHGVLKNSSLEKKDIEIVYFANKMASQACDQNHISAIINQILGTQVPVIRIEAACASGGVAVSQACLALESGKYKRALIIGAEKMTDLPVDQISYDLMHAASQQERDAGLTFVGLYALLAKKYLITFDATEKDLALPSAKNHKHAQSNPKAQFPFEISVEKIMASPLVADPIRLLHCSPITDGAAAVIIEKNKNNKNKIKIVASAQAGDTLALSQRETLTTLPATTHSAQIAYTQAGISPQDISFAEIHDCFSIAEILAVEDLGFCKKGTGFRAMRNGDFSMGGACPVNISGGLKACGHPVGATGVKQIVEIVTQLQNPTHTKLKKPLVGLAHNIGGTGGTAVIHILTK